MKYPIGKCPIGKYPTGKYPTGKCPIGNYKKSKILGLEIRGGGQGRRIRKVWGLEEGSMKIWAKLSRWGKVDWVPGSSHYTNMKFNNIENPKYLIFWANNFQNLLNSMGVSSPAEYDLWCPHYVFHEIGDFLEKSNGSDSYPSKFRYWWQLLLKYRSQYLQLMIMGENHNFCKHCDVTQCRCEIWRNS